jgi:PHP family Zn ribbon phosphoesterase
MAKRNQPANKQNKIVSGTFWCTPCATRFTVWPKPKKIASHVFCPNCGECLEVNLLIRSRRTNNSTGYGKAEDARPAYKIWSDAEKEALKLLVESGAHIPLMAHKLGRNDNSIRRMLQRLNIQLN